MESSIDAGLTVTYEEEAGVITFDWNAETHPEYNFLAELTQDELTQLLFNGLQAELDATSDDIPTR